MKRLWHTCLVAAMLSVTPASAHADDFRVDFRGLVIHVAQPGAHPDLAVVLQGDPPFAKHDPVILFPAGSIDPKTLTKALGKADVKNGKWSGGTLDGVRIRVVGIDPKSGQIVDPADPTNPGDPPTPDRSFDTVPHLGAFTTSVRQAVLNRETWPAPGMAAFVDLRGGSGSLSACAFRTGGQYYRNGHPLPGSVCRQFADVVTWEGSRGGRAVVQILPSQGRGGDWVTITPLTADPLYVMIDTLSNAHHTTTHFRLNEKLFNSTTLPQIEECDYCGFHPCDGCITSLVDLPGCTNSTWP